MVTNVLWRNDVTISIPLSHRIGSNEKQSKQSMNADSPQLILQKSNGQFQRNLSFFKAPDGVQFFPGGPTFSGECPFAYSL